jgi:hypothetical protein
MPAPFQKHVFNPSDQMRTTLSAIGEMTNRTIEEVLNDAVRAYVAVLATEYFADASGPEEASENTQLIKNHAAAVVFFENKEWRKRVYGEEQ